MRRGWKSLVTTQELTDFAKRHHVPLGRNPIRTLKLYCTLGLLPGRFRIAGRRVGWGFPPHARDFLIRIRDLKREGLILEEIKRAIQPEVQQAFETSQQDDEGLAGLPLDRPDWDYRFTHHEIMAKNALAALDRGDTDTVRSILSELVELSEATREGQRSVIVVGSDTGLVTTETPGTRPGKDSGPAPRELFAPADLQEPTAIAWDLSTYVAPAANRKGVSSRKLTSEQHSHQKSSRRRAVSDATNRRRPG